MCSGETIIAETDLVVPYSKILTYGIMLIVPLSIGVAITRWLPRLSALLVKCMKPMAFFLIVFILVCGIWSQFFMIKLITWKVAVVGFGLPWMGFAFGCLFSKLCRRERKDIIAIAIETGIQNTGKVMQIRFSNFLEHLFVQNLPVVICAKFTRTYLCKIPLDTVRLRLENNEICALHRKITWEKLNLVPRRSVHRQTDHATIQSTLSVHPTNRLQ
jgi:hypothetical protein